MCKQILLLVGFVSASGLASARGQVVQLPTYRVFSVSTTVSVPDRGAAYLGGVNRGTWSRSSRGVPGFSHVPGLNRLFTNRATGSSISSSHAYATATIIDHAEMDRMLLSEAAARRGESTIADETERRAAFLSAHVAKRPHASTSAPGHGDSDSAHVAAPSHGSASGRFVRRRVDASVAERPLASAQAQHEEEMATYLHRAELAEAAGRLGAARCCYDVLARRGSDEQQQIALQRLAALESPPAADKLADHKR